MNPKALGFLFSKLDEFPTRCYRDFDFEDINIEGLDE
jgi:hypothetical protein